MSLPEKFMDDETYALWLIWGQTDEDREALKEASVPTPASVDDFFGSEQPADSETPATCEARGRAHADTFVRDAAA